MNKIVSCICICLALVVAVMPLCAFKCADVPNAPAIVENRPVMASNRPFFEPVVEPPLADFVYPDVVPDTWVIDLSKWVYPPAIATNRDAYGFILFGVRSDTASMTISGPNAPSVLVRSISLKYTTSGYTYLSYSISFSDSLTAYDILTLNYGEVSDAKYIVTGVSKINYYTGINSSSNEPMSSGGTYNFPDGLLSVYVPPEPEPTVIEQLIDILVAGIGTFGANIGQGLTDIVVNVFVDTSQETFALTTFGGVVAVFAGLALAVGLSKLVTSFIMRLGGKE